MAGPGAGDVATCESCGGDGPVEPVVRMWVTPEAWDREGSVREGDRELWCLACRTHYPHREVLADEG